METPRSGPFERLGRLLGDMARTADALDVVAEHLERSTQKQQRMVEGMRRRANTGPAGVKPGKPTST